MKTIRRAFLMLKRSRKETASFLFTLTISMGLLLLFVNLQYDITTSMGGQKETAGNANFMMMAAITCIIAVVCAINCFISNTYFLKTKTQELCVYLSSGMNIVALAKYLVAQNMMILFTALPLGAILGCVLNPMVNLTIILLQGTTGSLFTMSWEGVFAWFAILLFEFIFMVMVNVGYAYKAELKDLLDESHKVSIGDSRMIKLSWKVYMAFYGIGIFAAVIMPMNIIMIIISSIMGFFGIQGILKYVLPAYIEKLKASHSRLEAERMIVIGNAYASLKSIGIYCLMLFGILLFMMAALYNETMLFSIQIILFIGYLLLMIMMNMSIYFKIMTEAKKRQKSFYHLQLIGFISKDLRSCIRKEVYLIILFMMLAPMPFALLISIKAVLSGAASVGIALFLLLSYIGLLMITGYISSKHYQNHAFNQEQRRSE